MSSNPDSRNKDNASLMVRVYFTTNAEHTFPARGRRNAREIAKRIVTEGAWIINDDGTEEFYPVHMVIKTKIVPLNKLNNLAGNNWQYKGHSEDTTGDHNRFTCVVERKASRT